MEIKIEEHLGLVHKALTKINLRNYEYEDLFQVGCVGLIKASKKFNTSKKIKFSTFAITCIKNEILRVFQLDRWYLGSQEERMKGTAKKPISLEKELNDNFNFYNLLKTNEDVEEYAVNKVDIERFLSTKDLTEKEKVVINLYYYKNYSVIEIGKLLGYSAQYISNIKSIAIKKMRQAVLAN